MEASIKSVLSYLENESLEKILQHLSSIGVRTADDMEFIKEDDLKHLLTPVDCRKLLHAFKRRGQLCDTQHNTQQRDCTMETSAEPDYFLTLTPVPYPETSPNSELALEPSSHVSVQNSTWVSTFSVPWEKTHESLRRQCAELAKSIVDKYPESFEDRTEEGEQLGNGYYTLSKQLRIRIDFLNRDNTLTRLRKPKRMVPAVDEDLPGPSRKCAKTDSYGCVNWQPSQLPEGQNRESLYEKKIELMTIYSKEGQRGADQKRVIDLMTLLYEQQRRDINTTPSPTMSDLQNEWPFLFMQKFLLQHFCTLTGIELESRLRESLAGKGKRVLQYFSSQLLKWNKEVKAVLHGIERQVEDMDPGLSAIVVMIAYFKEKEEAVFLLADETSTQADVEAQISLPSTPRLIMLGESILGAKKWMLSIEGRVVLQLSDRSEFTSALAVLFASYYVFNMEYPAEAATTLEFIQRFFIRINPEHSKCNSKVQVSRRTGKVVQRKNESLNPHMASFIRDFIEYDWKNN
uniref:Uncharacterized protein n=1 Tax=Cyprinus carpio carpio TaxID=630221 RepID=A0A9J8DLI9_CYPCA